MSGPKVLLGARPKVKVIEDVARATGKTRREVLKTVGASWDLSLGERSLIEEHLAQTPEPKSRTEAKKETEQASSARRLADTTSGSDAAGREVADIQAFREWRDLKASNPHGAALLINRSGDAIMRGRELDTDPPEPPKAA